MLQKGRLFCCISILVARLEWALAVSRLAIRQMRPQARIEHLRSRHMLHQPEQWIFSGERPVFVTIDSTKGAAIVRELPETVQN